VPPPEERPLRLLISFSPKDQALKDQLVQHLQVLVRFAGIDLWTADQIRPGESWREKLDEALEKADVALLLISSDFLASAFLQDVEVPKLFARREEGSVTVIPVLLRSCLWQAHPWLGALEPLPTSQQSVASFEGDGRDRVMTEVAAEIARRAGALPGRKASPKYADAETRLLSDKLAVAQARKLRLQEHGADVTELALEILDYKRRLREGGQLKAGDSLGDGRYVLLDVLGRGGFATVWRAHDSIQKKLVAIKVLHSNLAGDPVRLARFARGARVMASLTHEAVVRVLALGAEDAGFHYFVMELVVGGDVQNAILQGRLPRESVTSIILEVGDALAEAHDQGLIHRDVKPANILLADGDKGRLTDFDLVGAADTTGGTGTGGLGTFLYSAPECLDSPQDAGARADVYGLGMTTIFCFHGARLPREMLRQPSLIIDELSCGKAVKAVLKRSVQWDAKDRFRDAAAFCFSLRAALAYDSKNQRRAVQDISAVRPVSTASFDVEIDFDAFEPGKIVSVEVNHSTIFQEFLNSLWSIHAQEYTPVFTYGSEWTLVDPTNGAALHKIDKRDTRIVTEVGIVPGVRLIARRL
jgi:serine/threonine protein kinase